MPLSTLLFELFHSEYGLREKFMKSGKYFRLSHLTFQLRHTSVIVWYISIKFWFCASIWWTNIWINFQKNLKLKVGGSGDLTWNQSYITSIYTWLCPRN